VNIHLWRVRDALAEDLSRRPPPIVVVDAVSAAMLT